MGCFKTALYSSWAPLNSMFVLGLRDCVVPFSRLCAHCRKHSYAIKTTLKNWLPLHEHMSCFVTRPMASVS